LEKKRFLNLFNIINVKHFLCVKNETGYEFSIRRHRYGLMNLFIFELNEKKVNDDKRFRFYASCGSRSCATYLQIEIVEKDNMILEIFHRVGHSYYVFMLFYCINFSGH